MEHVVPVVGKVHIAGEGQHRRIIRHTGIMHIFRHGLGVKRLIIEVAFAADLPEQLLAVSFGFHCGSQSGADARRLLFAKAQEIGSKLLRRTGHKQNLKRSFGLLLRGRGCRGHSGSRRLRSGALGRQHHPDTGIH